MTDKKELKKIFSGDHSKYMWAEINALTAVNTSEEVGGVLYTICCRIQQLEAKYDKAIKNINDRYIP